MDQDWDAEEPQGAPTLCPPLTQTTLGSVARMGLLITSAGTVLIAVVNALIIVFISLVTAALIVGENTRVDDMVLPLLFIAITAFGFLATQLIPLASAIAGLYTAKTMGSGNRPSYILMGASGSLLGPLFHSVTSVVTLAFTFGLSIFITAAAMLTVAISAVSVAFTLVALGQVAGQPETA